MSFQKSEGIAPELVRLKRALERNKGNSDHPDTVAPPHPPSATVALLSKLSNTSSNTSVMAAAESAGEDNFPTDLEGLLNFASRVPHSNAEDDEEESMYEQRAPFRLEATMPPPRSGLIPESRLQLKDEKAAMYEEQKKREQAANKEYQRRQKSGITSTLNTFKCLAYMKNARRCHSARKKLCADCGGEQHIMGFHHHPECKAYNM